MPVSVGLVRAAMALRAESPEMWTGFLGAMREYAVEVQGEMIRCQPEMLVRAQGMAIMANEIASVLEDAPALFEKLQGARHGRER